MGLCRDGGDSDGVGDWLVPYGGRPEGGDMACTWGDALLRGDGIVWIPMAVV
jgi:hypothetical protein